VKKVGFTTSGFLAAFNLRLSLPHRYSIISTLVEEYPSAPDVSVTKLRSRAIPFMSFAQIRPNATFELEWHNTL